MTFAVLFPCHFLLGIILFTRDTCIYFVKFFKVLTCLEKIFLFPSSSNSYFHLCSYGWCFCIVLKWTVPTFSLHTLSDILEFFLIFRWVVLFPAFILAEGIYHKAFCMTSFSSWWLLLFFFLMTAEISLHSVGEILIFEQIVQ